MSRRYFLIPAILLSLAAPAAFASEKDELALVMRQLDQLQASLDRAQALSAQASGEGRLYPHHRRYPGDEAGNFTVSRTVFPATRRGGDES